jgi:hypothetical protein
LTPAERAEGDSGARASGLSQGDPAEPMPIRRLAVETIRVIADVCEQAS